MTANLSPAKNAVSLVSQPMTKKSKICSKSQNPFNWQIKTLNQIYTELTGEKESNLSNVLGSIQPKRKENSDRSTTKEIHAKK